MESVGLYLNPESLLRALLDAAGEQGRYYNRQARHSRQGTIRKEDILNH
jgi:hypothetical protein